MHDEFLTPNFKRTPYWWDQAPLEEPMSEDLPAQVDVAVVGGGLARQDLYRCLISTRAPSVSTKMNTCPCGSACNSWRNEQPASRMRCSYSSMPPLT